jgi:hypothetical protein
MYQDKAGRKRRVGQDRKRPELLSPFSQLTEHDVQRAAAGIL